MGWPHAVGVALAVAGYAAGYVHGRRRRGRVTITVVSDGPADDG